MSIPNIFNKIKSKFDIDKVTFVYLCIIIGVGIGAFLLGRLSADNTVDSDDNIIIEDKYPIENNNNLTLANISNRNEITSTELKGDMNTAQKKYVASKNGKLYYSVGCKAANRIKIENQIFFASASDALKSGYTASTSCK